MELEREGKRGQENILNERGGDRDGNGQYISICKSQEC